MSMYITVVRKRLVTCTSLYVYVPPSPPHTHHLMLSHKKPFIMQILNCEGKHMTLLMINASIWIGYLFSSCHSQRPGKMMEFTEISWKGWGCSPCTSSCLRGLSQEGNTSRLAPEADSMGSVSPGSLCWGPFLRDALCRGLGGRAALWEFIMVKLEIFAIINDLLNDHFSFPDKGQDDLIFSQDDLI